MESHHVEFNGPWVSGLVRGLEAQADQVIKHHGTKDKGLLSFDFRSPSWDSTCRLKLTSFDNPNATEIHELFHDEHRSEYMRLMLEGLIQTVYIQQGRLQNRLKSISKALSKGLTSLPDELLAIIFEFAASSEKGGRKHALWLSHVNRRFRKIVVGIPNLWTTLNFRAREGELEANIRRSADFGLHVCIHANDDALRNHYEFIMNLLSFLDECRSAATRWTTLKVSSMNTDLLDYALTLVFGRLNFDLPRLQELYFDQIVPFDGLSDRQEPIPVWNAPNLHFIRCRNYVPTASPSYSSLKSASLTVLALDNEEYRSLLIHLHAFLTTSSNISELTLDIEMSRNLEITEMSSASRQVLPSTGVTSFTLILPSYNVSQSQNAPLSLLFHVLRMPNLDNFTVSVDLYGTEITDPESQLLAFSGTLFNALLPDHSSNPKLTSVNFELACTLTKEAEQSASSWHVTVPLNRIPHVSTLTLRTFACPRFTTFDGRNFDLRCLRLQGWTRSSMNRQGVDGVIESLVEVDAWDALEFVEVEDLADFLEEEEVGEVYGAEKIYVKRGDGSLRNIRLYT